jgi:diguanylate cyclase (GGDEF)-like protein
MAYVETARDAEPLSREALFRLVGPLVAVTMAVLLSTAAPTPSTHQARLIVLAALLTAATAAATTFAPWHRLYRSIQAIPPLVYLVVAFLIQQAATDGHGYAQVALLPVVWLALYGTPRELGAGLAAVTLVAIAPVFIPGPSHVSMTGGLFLAAAAWFLGLVVQQLFGQMRAQTTRLRVLTREDDLTSVGNRRAWDDELDAAVGDARERHRSVSIVVLDLDRFKDFNDRHGHQAGDRMLREAAAAWSDQLREDDFLARLGGDEFAVILRGCGIEAAGSVAHRLCAALPPGGTCSGGVATWDGEEAPAELFARGDAALYQAKNAGRNRISVAGRTTAPIHI